MEVTCIRRVKLKWIHKVYYCCLWIKIKSNQNDLATRGEENQKLHFCSSSNKLIIMRTGYRFSSAEVRASNPLIETLATLYGLNFVKIWFESFGAYSINSTTWIKTTSGSQCWCVSTWQYSQKTITQTEVLLSTSVQTAQTCFYFHFQTPRILPQSSRARYIRLSLIQKPVLIQSVPQSTGVNTSLAACSFLQYLTIKTLHARRRCPNKPDLNEYRDVTPTAFYLHNAPNWKSILKTKQKKKQDKTKARTDSCCVQWKENKGRSMQTFLNRTLNPLFWVMEVRFGLRVGRMHPNWNKSPQNSSCSDTCLFWQRGRCQKAAAGVFTVHSHHLRSRHQPVLVVGMVVWVPVTKSVHVTVGGGGGGDGGGGGERGSLGDLPQLRVKSWGAGGDGGAGAAVEMFSIHRAAAVLDDLLVLGAFVLEPYLHLKEREQNCDGGTSQCGDSERFEKKEVSKMWLRFLQGTICSCLHP